MKRYLLLTICIIINLCAEGQTHKLLFKTHLGDFKVVLYDFTPHHRDLILSAIQDSVYKGAVFNRIIENFVVQGGEHDVDIAERESVDPTGAKPRLAAEFDPRAFHKIGALGAGRDDNAEKASFLNQIYFVVGKSVKAEDLDLLETKKNMKYSTEQRNTYLKSGGLPRLDGDYTVFGEVIEGLEVLMRISKVKTNKDDYPIEDVVFEVSEIK